MTEDEERFIVVGDWEGSRRLRVYRVARETDASYEITRRVRSTGMPRVIPKARCFAVADSEDAGRAVAALHQQMHQSIGMLLDGYRASVGRIRGAQPLPR